MATVHFDAVSNATGDEKPVEIVCSFTITNDYFETFLSIIVDVIIIKFLLIWFNKKFEAVFKFHLSLCGVYSAD